MKKQTGRVGVRGGYRGWGVIWLIQTHIRAAPSSPGDFHTGWEGSCLVRDLVGGRGEGESGGGGWWWGDSQGVEPANSPSPWMCLYHHDNWGRRESGDSLTPGGNRKHHLHFAHSSAHHSRLTWFLQSEDMSHRSQLWSWPALLFFCYGAWDKTAFDKMIKSWAASEGVSVAHHEEERDHLYWQMLHHRVCKQDVTETHCVFNYYPETFWCHTDPIPRTHTYFLIYSHFPSV